MGMGKGMEKEKGVGGKGREGEGREGEERVKVPQT